MASPDSRLKASVSVKSASSRSALFVFMLVSFYLVTGVKRLSAQTHGAADSSQPARLSRHNLARRPTPDTFGLLSLCSVALLLRMPTGHALVDTI
jgi:hypothetical protein